jgi:hypothetical protein
VGVSKLMEAGGWGNFGLGMLLCTLFCLSCNPLRFSLLKLLHVLPVLFPFPILFAQTSPCFAYSVPLFSLLKLKGTVSRDFLRLVFCRVIFPKASGHRNGPIGILIHEKTSSWKSRDTVPLTMFCLSCTPLRCSLLTPLHVARLGQNSRSTSCCCCCWPALSPSWVC